MTSAEQRSAVVAEALTWLRTPYHPCARVKGHGVDCAQILIEVYAAAGLIERFDTGHYPQDWMLHRDEERYLGFISQHAHQVPVPQPGDIALYRFGRCVSHGAIVIDWPVIVHAYAPEGNVCLGDGMAGRLGPRLAGFFSIFQD